MNNPIFLLPIIVGPIFIILGFVLLKFPPKKINMFYGYRTSNSMKSQERWDFAQTYSAKEMTRWGTILTMFSLVGLVYNPKEIISVLIGLGLMILTMSFILYRTEKAITTKFSNNKN